MKKIYAILLLSTLYSFDTITLSSPRGHTRHASTEKPLAKRPRRLAIVEKDIPLITPPNAKMFTFKNERSIQRSLNSQNQRYWHEVGFDQTEAPLLTKPPRKRKFRAFEGVKASAGAGETIEPPAR